MFLKHDLHTPLTQNMYFPENVNVPIATLSREFYRNLYPSYEYLLHTFGNVFTQNGNFSIFEN